MARRNRPLLAGVRRCLAGLAAGCAVVAAGLTPAHAAAGRPAAGAHERIASYRVRIAVRRDGSLMVTEQIVYDFGGDRRHGIFRDIPVVYPYSDRFERYLSVAVRSVTLDAGPVPYSVGSKDGSVDIKVGDPGHTISGLHVYALTYLVKGAMSVADGFDQLSWDAIGDEWAVPIGMGQVVVSEPVAPLGVACLTGPYGSTEHCTRVLGPDELSTVFVQRRLGPHDGMTVVVELPRGAVSVPPPLLRERWSWQRAFALTPVTEGVAGGLFAVLLLVIVPFVLARRRRWYARPGPMPGQRGTAREPAAWPGRHADRRRREPAGLRRHDL